MNYTLKMGLIFIIGSTMDRVADRAAELESPQTQLLEELANKLSNSTIYLKEE